MKLPNVKGFVTLGKTFLSAHRPEILFATSVVTTVGATVLAAKGGYEARGIVDAEILKRIELAPDAVLHNDPAQVDLTKREMANLTWHCYVPAAGVCLTSVGATTGLHLVHVKEKKALATMALAAIEEIKSEAKQFEKENLGVVSNEEKDKILTERQEKTPIGSENTSHVQYSDGEIEPMYLVRDHKTGRDIWSNKRRMEEAILDVNRTLAANESVELAQFYSNAGFAETEDSYAEGWNAGDCVEIKWDTDVRDDGQPVSVVKFRPHPNPGFRHTR